MSLLDTRTTQQIRTSQFRKGTERLRDDVLAFVDGWNLHNENQDWAWYRPTVALNKSRRVLVIRGLKDVKYLNHLRGQYDNYFFIDTGYMGNNETGMNPAGRLLYLRVVYNALQHTSIVKKVKDNRFRALREPISDWSPGRSILLCPPSTKSFDVLARRELIDFENSLNPDWTLDTFRLPGELDKQYVFQFPGIHGNSKKGELKSRVNRALGLYHKKWTLDAVRQIQKYTNRPIIIRGKPQTRAKRMKDANTFARAVQQDIWATVTYNSIVAVESVLNGVPAFVFYENAAAPVCYDDISKINQPFRPDDEKRLQWASYLACNQFTRGELREGTAYRIQAKINKL